MNEVAKYQKKLPSINDLYSTDLEILDKQNAVNILLNQEPKQDWVKGHPIAKKKVNGKYIPIDYIPIERIEWLLTNIFIKWRVEILDTKLIANSVTVTVRLHYRDPITGEWDWIDGIGAAPLQTDEGSSATDWNKIKSSAVMIAVPAAESYAVKDAAEKLGKLFGKDLNRADKIMYDTLQGKFAEPESMESKTQELINLIDELPELGLQAMYKDDLKKARKDGKFTMDFVNSMIAKVRDEIS